MTTETETAAALCAALSLPADCPPCRLCVLIAEENARIVAAEDAAIRHTLDSRARERAVYAPSYFNDARHDRKEAWAAAAHASEMETRRIIRERLDLDD